MMSIAVMTYFIIILLGRETHAETKMGTKRQSEIEKERDTQRNYILIYNALICVYCGYRGGGRGKSGCRRECGPGVKTLLKRDTRSFVMCIYLL
jgi:hypothetical protein